MYDSYIREISVDLLFIYINCHFHFLFLKTVELQINADLVFLPQTSQTIILKSNYTAYA